MAMNVKELAAKVDSLELMINQVDRKTDSEINALNQRVTLFIERIETFFNTPKEPLPQTASNETPEQLRLDTRNEPWRLPMEEFLAIRDNIKADWNEGGNVRVSRALARALERSCGHSEAQLYINWASKVGRAAVKKFWQERGHRVIPSGL